jgi:hypothetical protein
VTVHLARRTDQRCRMHHQYLSTGWDHQYPEKAANKLTPGNRIVDSIIPDLVEESTKIPRINRSVCSALETSASNITSDPVGISESGLVCDGTKGRVGPRLGRLPHEGERGVCGVLPLIVERREVTALLWVCEVEIEPAEVRLLGEVVIDFRIVADELRKRFYDR